MNSEHPRSEFFYFPQKDNFIVTQELSDDVLAIEEIIFNDHIDGLTYEQLMAKYGISKRQVGNLIAKAREVIYTRLMETGKRYLAEVAARYNYIYRQAQIQWEESRNPVFLKEMRECLAAERRLFGLDSAPKAAINEFGQAVPDKLVIIMNPSAYEQKEKAGEIVEGTAKEI